MVQTIPIIPQVTAFFDTFPLVSYSGTSTPTKAGVTPHNFGKLGVVVYDYGNMLYPMANYLQGKILIKIDFVLEHSMVVVSDSRFGPCYGLTKATILVEVVE